MWPAQIISCPREYAINIMQASLNMLEKEDICVKFISQGGKLPEDILKNYLKVRGDSSKI